MPASSSIVFIVSFDAQFILQVDNSFHHVAATACFVSKSNQTSRSAQNAEKMAIFVQNCQGHQCIVSNHNQKSAASSSEAMGTSHGW